MWEEWLNFLHTSEKTGKTPADTIRYLISESVIGDTEGVLKEYRAIDSGHEGFVYWAGLRSGDLVHINAVVAPDTISSEGRVSIPPLSNFYVIQCLSKENLIQLGQVHSHPGPWVGHSGGDDARAAFKREGLLSVVVPNYCAKKISLKECGIHRFQGEGFLPLSKRYVKKHFQLTAEPGKLLDLRNKNDWRWTHNNGIG
jgi:hypothetical protein